MNRANGFTIIEAIVVALLVAVLAAVAIPLYRGYVNDAQIRDARSRCEMIGAAIVQTRSRGIPIGENSWTTIGMTNPSDDIWEYTFPALTTSAAEDDYEFLAEGRSGSAQAGKTGKFRPFAAASRWTPP